MSVDLESQTVAAFSALAHLPLDERERRLAALPDIPPGMRERVRGLLAAADANQDGFLERPAVGTNFSVKPFVADGSSAPDSVMALPARIGPYEVIRLIAERHFTSVYLCRQDVPIRRVSAVKVLHSLVHRREMLRRFEWERQVIASLQHPNIAQFYEAGVTDAGEVYYSMEFIEGQYVTDFCEARSLTFRERLGLFIQICSAVEHAHQRGVIHRDLKPANILVQSDDGAGRGRVKVIDFGVAKAVNTGVHPAATIAGQLVGTFAYMSPEQLIGQPDSIDVRTDVFALGLILFELLTNQNARQVSDRPSGGAATNALTDPPLAMRTRHAALDEDLARIVGKATEHQRDARYASVAELREDVDRFLSDRPIAARPPDVVYLARKLVRRHRAAVAAAGLLLCVTAATLAMVWRARTQRLDLAVQLAEAWFEETRVMQSTIGEAALRGPALKRLSSQVAAFSQIAPEDPRIRAMQASSLTELGYAAIEADDLDAAEAAFREALAIRRELAGNGPRDDPAQMQLSLAMVRMGDVAGERGEVQSRLTWCLRALDIDERMLQRNPTDTHALSNLGWSYDRLGNIALEQRDLSEAEDYKRRAASVFDRLSRLGASPEALRGQAAAHLSLAEIYNIQERITEAARQASLALDHAKAAVQIAPADRFVLQVLVYSEFRHADLSRRSGHRTASLPTALDAVGHAELLLSLAPSDASMQRILGSALLTASQHAQEDGRTDLTVSLAQRALEELRRSTRNGWGDEHHQQMINQAVRLMSAGGAPPPQSSPTAPSAPSDTVPAAWPRH